MAGKNPIKQLAGQTAVYGLSTILARIINFLFVPFYTRLLTPESYGVVSEFMAYIAILMVVLTMGLETGCFRFANKEGESPDKVYSSAFVTVFGVSFIFFALVCIFSPALASGLGYEGFARCIVYVGLITALDCTTAIVFARLRQENKAFKFALIKTIKILTETAANFLFFFWYPAHSGGILGHFISDSLNFDYVIFATLLSCIVCTLLLLPEILRLNFSLDQKLMRRMLLYSLPLMVAALPGILNDFLDRILFRFLDTDAEQWRSSLGLFQASVKLSVIMSLFVQMFRFAAEPFFFQRNSQTDSKVLYARVMELFTAFCSLVFLAVIYYMDVIGLILGPSFRAGLTIVPIMLLAYMLLGMYFNVSMWYKLSDKTGYALWITLSGLVVTILVNVIFMPRYSYFAAAWAHVGSYLVMFIICVILGAKHYPIPYRWTRILVTILLMGIFYFILRIFYAFDWYLALSTLAKSGINTILLLFYCILLIPLLNLRKIS